MHDLFRPVGSSNLWLFLVKLVVCICLKDGAEWPNWFLVCVQSGCCKPSNDCGFTYVSPTNWTATSTTSSNPDCKAWSNDITVLCYNCQSCKAGLLDQVKTDWKKVAIVNIVFLIVLIIFYSIGCCAFRNNRRDNTNETYTRLPWGTSCVVVEGSYIPAFSDFVLLLLLLTYVDYIF